MGIIRRASSAVLRSPSVAVSSDMFRPHIVSAACHVVYDGIRVNSHVLRSTSFDHFSELVSCSQSAWKLIWNRLILEPPGVDFSVLRPFVCHDVLIWWKYLDSHVPRLLEEFAFLFNFFVRPSKQLNNGSSLTFVEGVFWRVNFRGIPVKVHILENDFVLLIFGSDLYFQNSGVLAVMGNVFIIRGDSLAVVVAVFKVPRGDARVSSAFDSNICLVSALVVKQDWKTGYSSEVLIGRLVVGWSL